MDMKLEFMSREMTPRGGIGQMIVAMTAWIYLMRILASVSTEAVAGATIAMRVMMFTLWLFSRGRWKTVKV